MIVFRAFAREVKIRTHLLLAAAAIATTACATHNHHYGAGPYIGLKVLPVMHAHNGRVHSHQLPMEGINHTHNVGAGAISNSIGSKAHSHSGKVHTHNLPKTGVNHTHRMGSGGSTTYLPPSASGVSNIGHESHAHPHDGRMHSHRLPVTGLNHRHSTGADNKARPLVAKPPVAKPLVVNNYVPPAANNTYQLPAGDKRHSVAHHHDGRSHSHHLPNSGLSHTHSGGTGNSTAPKVNRSGSTYYDYNNGTAAGHAVGNNGYYDYSSGGSSTYYNNTKPKGSNYYDHSASSNNTSVSTSDLISLSGNYSSAGVYTVRQGDTLHQVMRKTGVHWKDIARLNNVRAPNYHIYLGQKLSLGETARAMGNISCSETAASDYASMPKFPWRPPNYNKKYSLTKFFDKNMPLGDYSEKIISSLNSASKDFEYGIFKIPEGRGFAIVSRMEKIRENGQFVPEPNRWSQKGVPSISNIWELLHGLFEERPGYFRVVVFTVTCGVSLEPGNYANQADMVIPSIAIGASRLSPTLARRNASQYEVNALIYTFRKIKHGKPEQWTNHKLSARSHLEASGIISGLIR